MSIKLKKSWLITSFSMILFGLISVSIAQAANNHVFVTVLYNDNCPRQGAIVKIYDRIPDLMGYCNDPSYTNASGQCNATGMTLSPGTVYKAIAYYPPNTYWYEMLFQTDGNGNGQVTITKSENYLNLTEPCGEGACTGYKQCVGNPKYVECNSSNTDCSVCALCDGSGSCNVYDETQDLDCPTCQICSALDTCSNASSGTDPKNDCVGNCDNCDGSGSCAANETACESNYNCSSCTGSGTNYTCTYAVENDDCNPFDIFGIATCDWIPDDYHFTWDFRSSFDSQCLGINNCSQGSTTITHTCNQTCGAYCDKDVDCSNECDGKKWYSDYYCNDSCSCQAINPICSVGHCGAECDGPEECASGVCKTDCTCLDTTPPSITILSPQNATYYSNSTPLTFTINEPTSWIKYSLDNQPVVTITGNILMNNLADGSHNVIVYANDSSGNVGYSNRIYFKNNASVYLPWETSYIGTGGYPIIDIEEYNGKLYFAANNNNMYIFDGGSWNLVQAPTNTLSLQTFGTKLYVAGSGGKFYSYDGSTFTEVFNTGAQYSKMLGVYNSKLYAGTYLAKPAKLYYSSDGITWQEDTGFSSILNCPAPFCSIDSMGVFNEKMYVTSGGTVYKYDGSWSILQTYSDVASFTDMKVYNSKLYFATRDANSRCPMYAGYSGFCGRVMEYNGVSWNPTFFDHRGSNTKEGYWMYSLEVYNERLYAGTADRIYMYNGGLWGLTFNSIEGAQYALVLKNWTFNSINRIYVGFGNGIMFKDDLLEPKPDLIIEDIWNSSNKIYYKIRNQGSANAKYSYSKLYVDGSYKAIDFVSPLTAGSSSSEYFTYVWACSGTSDTIKVCADEYGYVTESNETNNCLTKTFTCPVSCTCTPWIWDDNGCCRIRTCTPARCSTERSCSKYCIW